MSLVVGTNTSAQFAQDALRANQHKTATAMQRLSTGMRINSARDDAAGLAISQSMTSQIRGLNQAVRNINDGINLLQTAEGGLGAITDMLQRMRELAVQSANGTNSDAQRAYLQKEAAALQEQLGKVVDTTTWNDKKLLDGSFTGQKIQVGADSGVSMTVGISAIAAGSSSTTINSATTAGTSVGSTALVAGDLTINSVAIGAAASSSAKEVVTAINLQTGATGVTATARTTASSPAAFVTPSSPPSVVDLGTYGKLINPVQIDGNHWFYYWDRNGNGSELYGSDAVTHAALDLIFNENATGQKSSQTDDTYHFGTINGVALSLPTLGLNQNQAGYINLAVGADPIYQTGTSVGSTPGQGSALSNSTYDDYLAIADAYNGISNNLSTSLAFDIPIDWFGPTNYWTASLGQPSAGSHIVVDLGHGRYSAKFDDSFANVALEVLHPKFFAAVDPGTIEINGVSIGAIASATTSSERQTQMLTAINAQSSNTGVTAILDANTGGLKLTAADGRNIEVSTLTSASIANSAIGISLNGLPSGNRTVTTFRSSVDLSSTSPAGITIVALGGGAAAAGLSSQSIAAVTTTVTTPAIDIGTANGATSAIGVIDSTLDSVNSNRSSIGSYINRLNYAGDNATNISTNLAASRSTIMDADYAEETANLAKSQIIQQAATAMLAQANQQPQSVLALLKNL